VRHRGRGGGGLARQDDRARRGGGAAVPRAPRWMGMGAARPHAAWPGAPPVVPGVVAPTDLDPPASATCLPDRAVGGPRTVAMGGGAAPVPGRVRPERPDRALRAHADRDWPARVAPPRPTPARVDPAAVARRGRG